MKTTAILTIGFTSLMLTACSSMDTQNTEKVKPAKAAEVQHTHPENCRYFAVTHTHGEELGGMTGSDHDHGRGCK